MKWRGIHLGKTIFIFFVVLSLGLGMQYYFQRTQVIGPLREQLQALPGVAEACVTQSAFNSRAEFKIDLVLEDNASLALTFQKLQSLLEGVDGQFLVRLAETTPPELWSLFQKIQLPLEEALITGEFSLLEKRIEALGAEQGVQCSLALDRHYIYIGLENSKGVLHKVISRGGEEGRLKIRTEGVISYEEMD